MDCMAFEPTTEAGKKAIADGADPVVVEEMEKDGSMIDVKEEPSEHVEKETPEDKNQDDKGPEDGQGGDEDKGKKKDDAGKEGEGDEGQPNREAKHMPIWKHKEELKKEREKLNSEFEKKLQDAASKQGGATDADIKKLSEEFGLSEENASAMVDRMAGILEQRLGIETIRKNESERQERDQEIAEAQGFSKEWDSKTTQDSITAAANGRQMPSDLMAKVKELAYSTEYARYRLSDIVRLHAGTLFATSKKKSPTAEHGRGGASGGDSGKNINEMSPEEINNLSDEEFQKLSDELGGKGSRFSKTTKPKK